MEQRLRSRWARVIVGATYFALAWGLGGFVGQLFFPGDRALEAIVAAGVVGLATLLYVFVDLRLRGREPLVLDAWLLRFMLIVVLSAVIQLSWSGVTYLIAHGSR